MYDPQSVAHVTVVNEKRVQIGMHTNVLLVCKRCGHRKTEKLDGGRWSLAEVRGEIPAKDLKLPWRGYARS